MNYYQTRFSEKLKEALKAVAPIIGSVLLLSFTIAPIPPSILLLFLFGAVLLIVGMMFFTLGAELSMTTMGEKVGTKMAKTMHLGQMIADLPFRFILIPIGMVIGFFIVKAEPAVYVLMDQVEEITSGAIPGKAMGLSMSLGVAASVGISMIRVLTGVSILWFIVPGYIIAICLSFFVPKIFTAIAFDSGGVTSGPMTATFLLPFAMGACQAVSGNIVRDAFGIVAMVAMTPLIAIQILGAVYQFKSRAVEGAESAGAAYLDTWGDDDIIEL